MSWSTSVDGSTRHISFRSGEDAEANSEKIRRSANDNGALAAACANSQLEAFLNEWDSPEPDSVGEDQTYL